MNLIILFDISTHGPYCMCKTHLIWRTQKCEHHNTIVPPCALLTLSSTLSRLAEIWQGGLMYVCSRGWAHSIVRPWVPFCSLLTRNVYLLPFCSYLTGSKSVSAARPTRIRWQIPLKKLQLRQAAKIISLMIWIAIIIFVVARGHRRLPISLAMATAISWRW